MSKKKALTALGSIIGVLTLLAIFVIGVLIFFDFIEELLSFLKENKNFIK